MNIIFAGTPDFAVPCLKMLIKNFDVCAVITQPDRRCGRGRKLKQSPVKELVLKFDAKAFDIACRAFRLRLSGKQCQKQRQNITVLTKPINQLLNQLTKLKPDLIVVAAYGQILSQKIINIPRYGAINIHASLLPKYRGPSPIQAAILNGDKETGVSIIKMTADLDAGPIIAQSKIKIAADETAGSLHDKLARLGAELLWQTLNRKGFKGFKSHVDLKPFHPRSQNHYLSTYTHKITPADVELDLSKPADDLERQIRAYNPLPGMYLRIADCGLRIKRLKIWQAKIKQNSQSVIRNSQLVNSPIDKFKIYQNRPALICGDGNLLILTHVQPEGRKKMSGEEFARGYLTNCIAQIVI